MRSDPGNRDTPRLWDRRPGVRVPGRRRNRGDVRTAVLALVSEQPMHGYQIIQEIARRSDGAWRPSPGSIYPAVSRLTDEDLVRTEKADSRSVIHLTEQGRRYVDEHRAELDAVWRVNGSGFDDQLVDLRAAGRDLIDAAAQVGHVGSPDQITQAIRMITETGQRLYLLLAGHLVEGIDNDPTDEQLTSPASGSATLHSRR